MAISRRARSISRDREVWSERELSLSLSLGVVRHTQAGQGIEACTEGQIPTGYNAPLPRVNVCASVHA